MSGCCVDQCAYQVQTEGLPVRFGDKTLWYGLIAFYAAGAIYMLGILAAEVF